MVAKSKNTKTHNKILGIEISENSFSLVEIFFVKNNIILNNAFTLNFPIFQDLNKTVAFVKQNLKALNIKTKECAIGFSMQYFNLFPIPIPENIPINEIDSIVLQEASIDLGTNNLTWAPLNNTKRQDADGISRYDILGIAIKHSLVDLAKTVSKRLSLNLLAICPAFFTLGILLNPKVSNNLTTTLWISQIRSELTVWSGQEPIYEHLFLTHQLNDHVFQSINHVQSQLQGAQINNILICGPNIKDANLTQLPYKIEPFSMPQGLIDNGKVLNKHASNEIIVPTTIALSFSNHILFKVPDLLLSIKPATKGFQEIFKGFAKVQSTKSKSFDPLLTKYAFVAGVILVLSVLCNFFIQSFLIKNLQSKGTNYQNRIALSQVHLAKVTNFEKTNKVLSVKFNFLSELIDKRKPWSKILREIADITPKELWIDRLELRDKNVDIFGRALNVDAIANFSINLNYNAKLLTNAQIIALRKFQEEGIDIIEFQLSAKLKKDTIVSNEQGKVDFKGKSDKPLKT